MCGHAGEMYVYKERYVTVYVKNAAVWRQRFSEGIIQDEVKEKVTVRKCQSFLIVLSDRKV